MDDKNPYRAPEAPIADQQHDPELAGLGERLAAAIIDTVIMLAVLLPVMWFGGYFRDVMNAATAGQSLPIATELLWGLISLIIFFAIQAYPLHTAAQTWGKRVLGIRIVDLNGTRSLFGKLSLLRYLPMQGIGLLPFIGPFLSVANVLFIFRNDRRCVHDLIAGTKVVKAR